MKKILITIGVLIGVLPVIYSYEGIGYAPDKGQVAGDGSIGGNLSVTGTSALTGDGSIGGNLSVTGTSDLTGAVTLGSRLNLVGGSIYISGEAITLSAVANGKKIFESTKSSTTFKLDTYSTRTLYALSDLSIMRGSSGWQYNVQTCVNNSGLLFGMGTTEALNNLILTDYDFNTKSHNPGVNNGHTTLWWYNNANPESAESGWTNMYNRGEAFNITTASGTKSIKINIDNTSAGDTAEITSSSFTVNVPFVPVFVDTGTTPTVLFGIGRTAQGVVYIATATVDVNSWQKVGAQ